LILPEVICLSKRLSHAAIRMIRINLFVWEWLIKLAIIYLIVKIQLDG